MDYNIKRASALSSEEQEALGITGIPQDWPVERYLYVDNTPERFELISDINLQILIDNNQTAYDAWLQAKRPIIQASSIIQEVKVVSQPEIQVQSQPAFAAKSFNTAQGIKKLYARVHGIQQALTSGANTIDFTIPYPWVKITGLMVFSGEALDTVDLSIYDTATGTYSGVPNYKLNQFGFAANISKDSFEWTSPYDADLYQGMIIKITYNSVSAKTIGINYILNECK
jgi:hypothetical protein